MTNTIQWIKSTIFFPTTNNKKIFNDIFFRFGKCRKHKPPNRKDFPMQIESAILESNDFKQVENSNGRHAYVIP